MGITTGFMEIKSIIRENCEQLYINKLDSIEEIGKFLEIHKLQKLIQTLENVNRIITSKDIDSVIKIVPTKKIRDQITSMVNFANHVKEN